MNTLNILIVEDEPSMQIGLRDNLEFEGFTVTVAGDGEKALEFLRSNEYNLILLDIMIPKISGFEVCKTIRKEGIETPVIFLTAKGEEIDKVLGLELGADDYITKPFSVRELIARVKAVSRRSKSNEKESPQKIQIGNLLIDFSHFIAKSHDIEVKMSYKEMEVIQYLWEHKNEIVSRHDLLEKVWKYDEQPTTRTVDNFILKLRQKIEDNPNEPRHILTVHGVGYKLIV
ncbi:MAG: DNA-binding response OmpR family regulator [Cyclobacteriaceae bacterium]|jgi:DNA-binding response OmpR family regulator